MESPAKLAPRTGGEAIRVLVVDDNQGDADLIDDLLGDAEIWDVETIWAPTYERGLELIRDGRIDICLLDYHLGAQSGIDFLEEPAVRAARIPVIFMTGLGSPEVDRRAWEAGAADYLPKDDLSPARIDRSIRYALESRRRREVEGRFEALVGSGRELVSVVARDGTLRWVSPSLSRILGFDPEEKMGSSALAEVHPEDREDLRRSLAEVVEDPDRVHRFDHRFRHADGSWRVLDTLARNRLDDPVIQGLVVSAWDVTERKEDEERLRFQAELLDAVGQAVIATSMEGKVLYWNQAAERIYGWSENEALGEDVMDLTPARWSEEGAREVMKTLGRGEPWSGEFQVRRKDGSTFPVLIHNSPVLDSEGRPVAIIGASSDISELKETEHRLQERVKELRVLFRATRILNDPDASLEERLQGFVDALPAGWLHPGITEARVILPDTTVQTEGFRESSWMLSAPVQSGDSAGGRLEVALTEEPPEEDEGAFLPEERDLLDTLARTLGEALERNRLNRHLTQTIASLDEAVLVVDSREQGRKIQSVNPAAERIFGYSTGEMMGRTTEFLHASPESFRRFAEEGNPVLRRGETFHTDFPMRRKDGTVFAAEETVSLLDPDKGLDGGVVSVIRDISEARKAQAELEASEERFRQIAERIEDVFWITAPDKSEVEYISPAYRSVWGREREELYEDPAVWMEAIHPDDRERVRTFAARQQEGEAELEYRIRRPDGEVRWIHDRAFPVEEGDRLRRIVGVAEDITERKRTEERLSVLSREISEAILILDPDGMVRFATPSVKEVAGYTREEFEGRNALEIVHREDRPEVSATLRELAAEPDGTIRVQHRILHRSGEVRHVESVGRNRLEHPGVEGLLITSRDVTDRIELEEMLRRSQRLEAIGRLAGGIAHDFNNLLTVIRSQTDLLLLDLDSTDPNAEEVELIQSAADRATGLTQQLLAFSRDQILRPRVVNLCDVVRKMGELLERVLGDDVEVVMELAGDLPPIEVDPAQLEQVVLNLAINARDAMVEGGTLTLTTHQREVDDDIGRPRELDPGTHTILEVSDTGHGMEEDTQARVFEPFFTTKGSRGGTGLGLAMAYGFMKQTGGAIEVNSTLGEGTTFTLYFPTVDRAPDPFEPIAPSKVSTVDISATILLVEDDESVRKVAARILERAGLEVIQAESAEAGFEALGDEAKVDLVLTDLTLPGASGREVARRLKKEYPEVGVVVMSGYAGTSPGHRGELPAEIPFIQKPFTPDDLIGTVRRVLEEK